MTLYQVSFDTKLGYTNRRAKYPDTSPAPTTINRSTATPTKMKKDMAKDDFT